MKAHIANLGGADPDEAEGVRQLLIDEAEKRARVVGSSGAKAQRSSASGLRGIRQRIKSVAAPAFQEAGGMAAECVGSPASINARTLPMTYSLLATRRFAPLFWCQFFSAFNDNFLKNALAFLILFKWAGPNSESLISLATAVLIFPYFIL
jgi:hypothetical protein